MAIERARNLRQNPTDAEKRLWSKLRLKQVDGHRFRRQVPIGPYVVDFCCLVRRLVIEVDGGHQGFQVLRFWNNDVLGNISGVLATIAMHLAGGESPPP